MVNKNTRGSEWQKWDLHIHTPNTGKMINLKKKTMKKSGRNI